MSWYRIYSWGLQNLYNELKNQLYGSRQRIWGIFLKAGISLLFQCIKV